MSENTQNNRAPSENEKKEQRPGGHRNRHRPHHHNRGNRPPRKEGAEQTPSVSGEAAVEKRPQQQTEGNQKPASRPQGNHNNHRNNNQRRGKGGKDGENRQRFEANGGRNAGNNRYAREKCPYSPYETPDKEEIALSELRAQIVLQAADGSVPTAYGSTVSPAASTSVTKEPEAIEALATENNTMATSPDEAPMSPAPEEPTPVTEEAPKVEVVGVRFRSAGKMYYFDPHGITVQKGESVIVETTRGPEFGDVCLGNSMINVKDTVAPLRPLIRVATPEDIAHNAENREKEQAALGICQEKIRAHGLEMKLIDVQYAFDNSKLLFYFSAEGRVDFRELVKDLASVFRTRIELRQIGIRDEAKMLGGIGACGRTLCCSTFLPDFAQVSIKMAKEQNLSLNSSKISGVCGRLMCCLRYESEVYSEEIRRTPANDSTVRTEDGIGTVIGSNPLAGTVRVILKDSPDTTPKQYHRDNVTVLPKERRADKNTEKQAPAQKND